jgi:catechol 2,3-dioxygenase-like lactoylglutathione lyase family enzyme
MLDHVFLTVSDIERSTSFYEQALAPLGINERFDYDGRKGPPGHPDLKGFGASGRLYLWLREGAAHGHAAHIGFVADSRNQVGCGLCRCYCGRSHRQWRTRRPTLL